MSEDLHALTVGTFAPMLRNLDGWLDTAVAGGAEPLGLIEARLAPDMYDLAQQVDLACRHASETVARLTGQPSTPAGEAPASLAGLKALIARTVAAVEAAPAAAFEGAASRDVLIAINEQVGFRFSGERLVRDWGLPHFYFHLVTAYGILRSRGAQIGKQDYLSQVADAMVTP